MLYETEFRFTCRDRDRNAIYWDIPTGQTDFLKFGYVISNKDNVFTVKNSLGRFTVLAKMYQFLVTYLAAFVSVASDVLLLLSIAVHSTKLPVYSLQNLLTGRFYHLQRCL